MEYEDFEIEIFEELTERDSVIVQDKIYFDSYRDEIHIEGIGWFNCL